jgi:hypothetical protein
LAFNAFLFHLSHSSGKNVQDLKQLVAKQNRKDDLSDFNTDEESQKLYDMARANRDAEEVQKRKAHLLEKCRLADLPNRKPRPLKRPFLEITEQGQQQVPPFVVSSLGPVEFPQQQQMPSPFVVTNLGPVEFQPSIVAVNNGSNERSLVQSSSSSMVIHSHGVSAAEDLGLPPSAIIIQKASGELSNAGLTGTMPLVFHHPQAEPLTQTVLSDASANTATEQDKDDDDEDEDSVEMDDFGGQPLHEDSDAEDDDFNGSFTAFDEAPDSSEIGGNRGGNSEQQQLVPPYSPTNAEASEDPAYCTVAQYTVSNLSSHAVDLISFHESRKKCRNQYLSCIGRL